MKPRTGCHTCRSRHRRCVFPENGLVCFGCLEAGVDCLRPTRFLFAPLPQGVPEREHAANKSHAPVHRRRPCRRSNGNAVSSPNAGIRPQPSSLSLNEREGQLFTLYVTQLAPMMDSCDQHRHFTLVVPRLALHEPMLLNSILAMSSRYDALRRRDNSDNAPPDADELFEAVRYNDKSIEGLIASLARPPSTYGGELLAAIVMTRSYEECDFEMDRSGHHLSGTRNLLLTDNAVTLIASKGGLAEAACWVHLRQAIYAYLVRGRRPIDSHIDAFRSFATFGRRDDAAVANHMVHHFARTLRLFFQQPAEDSSSADVQQQDTWDSLRSEIDTWYKNKPVSFLPICTSSSEEQTFRVLLMVSSVPVMGLQYYYAAMIIFQLQRCQSLTPHAGVCHVDLPHEQQSLIAHYLCTIMGLALSNDHVLDSFLLPTHMLSVCGYCIRDMDQRDKTVQFLHKANLLTKWITGPLIRVLMEQWAEADAKAC